MRSGQTPDVRHVALGVREKTKSCAVNVEQIIFISKHSYLKAMLLERRLACCSFHQFFSQSETIVVHEVTKQNIAKDKLFCSNIKPYPPVAVCASSLRD